MVRFVVIKQLLLDYRKMGRHPKNIKGCIKSNDLCISLVSLSYFDAPMEILALFRW